MRRTSETEDLLREAAPRVLAALVRRFGDFSDSEDAVQEALIDAARQWPAQGTPENPVGWLVHVASRRMTDRIRSDSARRGREEAIAADRAEPTMAQRISRAKQTIKASPEPFAMPAAAEREERLRSLLRIVYLIFNEGYVASSGAELARTELSGEAIRLARIVRLALPEDPEVAGLLALMLLTDARRPARSDADGELIPLEQQDRSLWDRELTDEGLAVLAEALRHGAVGEYQLQAAIAAEHAKAARVEDTNWREILGLYGLLERISANPMVALNRAIAAAMVDGPRAGLDLLARLDEQLAGHHRLHAARAHLLEMSGDPSAAIAEYRTAAELTKSLPEQRYLTTQAARLNAGHE